MKTSLIPLIAALVILSGCGTSTDTTATYRVDDPAGATSDTVTPGAAAPDTPESRLEVARNQWASLDMDHYRWRYQRICFCPGMTMDLEVEDGRVVTGKNVADGRQPNDSTIKTMDDLFDLVQSALRDSYTVNVTYDHETGAVRKLVVDHIKNAADDEYSYVVKHVEPLD